MNAGPVAAALLAWPLISAALTRAIGPGRALLVAVIGGHLFLPVAEFHATIGGVAVPFGRWASIALAAVLGPLAFDLRTLLRARPSWLDLAAVAGYLAPLVGLVTGQPGTTADILDEMIGRGPAWILPYAMARVYFSRREGPAEVAVGLVAGGLAYVPVCLYEELAGPSNYLAVRIFGIGYHPGMVDRLGGYRPEGFLNDGIAVSGWMALTTVLATWLWLGGWRPRGRWPAWPVALALLLTTLSCRGMYGYALLAIGLPAAFLTRWLRTRFVVAALLVLPLAYMAARGTGAWDGAILLRWASATGRAGSLGWRLLAEDEVIGRVLADGPAFGHAGHVWKAGLPRLIDGRWLHTLWAGGFVGLTLQVVAYHLLPATLALRRPRSRPDARQAASPSWGLACWCALHLLDSLHNTSYFLPTALAAGALVGTTAWRGAETYTAGPGPRPGPTPKPRPAPPDRDSGRRPRALPLIATAIVLVAIEALGRWRSASMDRPLPPAPRAEQRDSSP